MLAFMAKPDQDWAKRTMQQKGGGGAPPFGKKPGGPKGGQPGKPKPPAPGHDEADEPEHDEGDESGEPAFAAEMESWLEDLAGDHPLTAEWIRNIGKAIEDDDDEALADLWTSAPTDENPEYPELDEGEQKKAQEAISKHLGHQDHTHDQAVAIGLREAAPEKYKQFDKAHKAGK
jgi:hypothetical protein